MNTSQLCKSSIIEDSDSSCFLYPSFRDIESFPIQEQQKSEDIFKSQ